MTTNELPSHLSRRGVMAMTGLMAAGAMSPSFGQNIPNVMPKPVKSDQPPPAKPAPINVAVVLGAYNTLIDFAGPWEVLSSSNRFNLYSVAATRKPVLCDDARSLDTRRPISGLTVVPDFTFDNAPAPRIILVGGQDEGKDEAAMARKVEWIRRASKRADLTSSVCVGAFILGKAGLLDGKSATTNRHAYDEFERTFPKVKLVRGVRFVESGRISTTAGLMAGIDLALRITERYFGHSIAQKVADYEEWPGKEWANK